MDGSYNFEEESGVEELYVWLGDVDGSSWLGDNSFGGDSDSLFVGFSLEFIVFSNSV